MQKLIRFIKYNNAFVIILGLIFASAGGVFANETSREAIIGKTVVTRIGVDNSRIVGADLGSFSMDFKITKVTEDGLGYNVGYSYNTIYIKDNVWQPLIKEGEMYVSKAGLGDMDLGLYIADELGQKADREVAYLKEVQSIEKTKGVLKQKESVEYTGLKGLVFNSETKELAGYKPVKEQENQKAEVAGVFNPSTKTEEENKTETSDGEGKTEIGPQVTVVKEVVSRETIMKMVKDALAKEKSITLSTASTTDALSSASSTVVSSSSSSSVVSGGGGETAQSSSNSSASSGSEAVSSSSESSNSSLNQSSQSSDASGQASSSSLSSSEASSSSSSESQPSLESTAGQASSSSVSSASSSETASSTSSSSESSSSSSTSSQVESSSSSSSQSPDISSSSISSSSSSTASESSSSVTASSSSEASSSSSEASSSSVSSASSSETSSSASSSSESSV